MSSDNDKDIKDFPFPLGEWVEEQIPVKKNRFDPDTKSFNQTVEYEKVRTQYINAPKEMVRCSDNDHSFSVLDPHKWIFVCSNCHVRRKASPLKYKFLGGKLIAK